MVSTIPSQRIPIRELQGKRQTKHKIQENQYILHNYFIFMISVFDYLLNMTALKVP